MSYEQSFPMHDPHEAAAADVTRQIEALTNTGAWDYTAAHLYITGEMPEPLSYSPHESDAFTMRFDDESADAIEVADAPQVGWLQVVREIDYTGLYQIEADEDPQPEADELQYSVEDPDAYYQLRYPELFAVDGSDDVEQPKAS